MAEKLLKLSYMWFSDHTDEYYEGPPENMSEYDTLEERLITRGMINHETDRQALDLEKRIRKELDKEKKAEKYQRLKEKIKESWERVRKMMRWIFPDYRYMASIYSILDKVPILLPVYWIVRDMRLLGRLLRK